MVPFRNVFKFLKSLFHAVCSKVWNKSFKDLNSRTLIKEKKDEMGDLDKD